MPGQLPLPRIALCASRAAELGARSNAIATLTGGPVATYGYDANGNVTSGGVRTQMSFNLPKTITKGAATLTFAYGTEHQARHRGFTYIYVLLLIALMSAGLAMAGTVWRTEVTRAKEAELLFIGHDFRQALASFYSQTPGSEKRYPKSLEDLLLDPRFPQSVRHLRRIYRDPMTSQNIWGLVRNANGDIVGIHSLSTERPMKVGGFTAEEAAFNGAERYDQWVFAPAGALAGAGKEREANSSSPD